MAGKGVDRNKCQMRKNVKDGYITDLIGIIRRRIMCIYHVLINALSTHNIHINLNIIFCTYVEDSPAKTIYIRHYMETHTITHTHTHTVAKKWVVILVGAEIL